MKKTDLSIALDIVHNAIHIRSAVTGLCGIANNFRKQHGSDPSLWEIEKDITYFVSPDSTLHLFVLTPTPNFTETEMDFFNRFVASHFVDSHAYYEGDGQFFIYLSNYDAIYDLSSPEIWKDGGKFEIRPIENDEEWSDYSWNEGLTWDPASNAYTAEEAL